MVHVVYLVAPDTPDERLDEKGILDCSVRAWNQWFAEQTEGLKWRIDVYRAKSAGRRRELVDVTFVQSSRSAEELVSPGGVGAELEAQGLEDPNKKYVAYVEAQSGNVCGSAAYPVTGPDPTDPFSGDGQYAYVYLLSDPDCHSRDFGIPGKPSFPEGTVMHELLHTEAVVPIGAPHHCLFDLGIPPVGHVCTGPLGLGGALVGADLDPESEDVMFPFAGTALSENVLDRDRDDYFDHPFPYRDLADSPYLSRR